MIAESKDPKWVRERHQRVAQKLMESGFYWEPIQREHRPQVADLVRETLVGYSDWEFPDEAGGIRVTNREGDVVAALVLGGFSLEQYVISSIIAVCVRPEYRGLGLGHITLNLGHQMFKGTGSGAPDFIYGNCEESSAEFYAKAGYNVTGPREPIFLPGREETAVISRSDTYKCWFYRYL